MYGAFNWEGERKGREGWTNTQLGHPNLRAAEAHLLKTSNSNAIPTNLTVSMEILVTCENPQQD